MDFFNHIEKAALAFKKTKRDETIRLISHLDADGICAASIMIKTLNRLNRKYSVSIIHQLSEDFLKEISHESYKIYIFTDLGSGQVPLIKKYLKGKEIFVLDHHKPSEEESEDIVEVNPNNFGIEGSKEISGAGVVFLFCKDIDKKNEDLAHLAVIGAIGDVQEDHGFSGINKEILKFAVKTEKIKIEKSLRLFGITTRPIHKVLEYSSDPYIPRISGSESNAIQFLHKLGIEIKDGNKWKTFNDLKEDEKKKLISAIILERIEEENPEDVFGNLYLLVEEDDLTLSEAREFSTLLNACGRLDKASLGIGVCLNDEKMKKKAIRNLSNYKKEISKAIRWYEENKESKDIVEGKNYIIINAKDNVLGTVIGTLASILSKSNGIKDKYILSIARLDNITSKASLRYSGISEKSLKEIVSKIVEKTGGEAGGHKSAAGALIDRKNEDSFIKEAEKIFKEL
jgi:single-stranded-DNA-specific exonuclease